MVLDALAAIAPDFRPGEEGDRFVASALIVICSYIDSIAPGFLQRTDIGSESMSVRRGTPIVVLGMFFPRHRQSQAILTLLIPAAEKYFSLKSG
jgi:hypothetical protein